MLDPTARKILDLILSEHAPEIRRAALLVLGEIRERHESAFEAVRQALDDPAEAVRLAAIAAVGRLKIENALPALLDRISRGGLEAEAAAQAAAQLGARGTRALQELMHSVAPGIRRRIAAALGTGGTASAGVAAVDALLDSDPGVVDAAVSSLISELEALTPGQRRGLADHCLDLLRPKKKSGLPLASEAALVRLLAALADPRGEGVFWNRISPDRPPLLRASALQALGGLGVKPNKANLKDLFQAAVDSELRVSVPALMVLKNVPVNAGDLTGWLTLFDAPDPAARHFVLEKLAGKDHQAIARAAARQLSHPDQQLRNDTLKFLGRTRHGRDSLVQSLLDAGNADQAWQLARALAAFAREASPAAQTKVMAAACNYLELGDRRADALLFWLREADSQGVRDRLEDRGLALRKKKKLEQALAYFRYLARDPACAEGVRFELAACGLKLSTHDLSVDSRQSDPALQQFERLIRSHEVDPAERVRQAKWLGPEDLFYLGFHFAEGHGSERAFAALVLQLLGQRFPRSKLARDARSRLRSTGLA